MSCIFLVLSIGLISGVPAGHGEWISLGGEICDPVEVVLLESSTEGFTVSLELPGFTMTETPGCGGVYYQLGLLESPSNWDSPGMPAVPLLPSLVGIPHGCTAVVSSVEMETVVFENIMLYPVQEPATDHEFYTGSFVMDGDAYQSSEPYPAESAAFDLPGVWSGVDVARLVLYPFRYTASDHTLSVASSMIVTVSFEGPHDIQTPVSPAIQLIHKTQIINYESLGIPEADATDADDPIYIVITTDENLEFITPLLQVDHVLGHHMQIEVLAEGSTSSQIMSAITSNYEAGITRFVLIVARHQELPSFNYGGFYGDFFYSNLEAGNYPDVGLGRIAEAPPENITNQVNKILSFIGYTGTPGEVPISASCAAAAHEEGYPGGYTSNKNSIVTWPYSALDIEFTTFYPNEGATAEELQALINEGVGTVNYRGHGTVTVWQWGPGWNTGRIYNLENTFFPVVFNIACLNGNHTAIYNCLCQSWMDADNKGASGNFGASAASYTTANHRLDRAIYWTLYDDEISAAGEAMADAVINMINYTGGLGITNSHMYHWFGDPAMDIVTTDELGAPFALVLSGNGAIGPGAQSETYTVVSEGSPVEGVTVTASDGIGNHPDDTENFYESGTTNSSGQVTLSFTSVENDDITVGAWKHNYVYDTIIVTVGGMGTGGTENDPMLFISSPRPNPCRSVASLDYTLPSTGYADLYVMDLSGRRVSTLVSGELAEGAHSVSWDTTEVPSGLYFVRLATTDGIATARLMVVK